VGRGPGGPVRLGGTVGRARRAPCTRLARGWPRPAGTLRRPDSVGERCPQMWWWCLCSGAWTWTPWLATPAWEVRSAGPGRWTRRRAAGWPVMAPSPGCWSPATGPTTPALTPKTTQRPETPAEPKGWEGGSEPRRRCFLRSWGVPHPAAGVGRTTRVVQPAQRVALAVRDGGCVFPGCARPLAWCEAHHLRHWLHGGPTDLANLALVCRAHHRAVHEGGWRLARARTVGWPPAHRIEDPNRHPPPPEPGRGGAINRGPASLTRRP
jgi:HNH endonuclease